MMQRLRLVAAAAASLAFSSPTAAVDGVVVGGGALPPSNLSLLYIFVDDLRAQAGGPFGQSMMSTPALDALAARGVAFTRAYCQVSVCSPSRTSTLTGMRPAATRLWTIGPYFRSTAQPPSLAASIVTLPQALKASGFTTTGMGKVWHPGTSSGGDASWGGGSVGGDDMPHSFNFTPAAGVDPRLQAWECDAWMNSTGQSAASAGLRGAAGCVTSPACVACLVAHNGTDGHAVTTTPCPDDCYVDAMVAREAGAALARYGASGERFAAFVGLKRPHLGFQIPQWALDAYPADPPLAALRVPPPGMPPAGWWRNGEMDGLADVRPFVERDNASFPGLLQDAAHARLRRAYYASVSWMDAQLGKILDALDASGRAGDTLVVLHGDHGWSLGDHGNWAKQSLFDAVARVPLIIAPPRGAAGFRTGAVVGPADGFAELVDLFPTLAELLGVAAAVPPGQLSGTSLAPLLRAAVPPPAAAAAAALAPSAAFTQIVRLDRNCTPPSLELTPAAHAADSDPPTRGAYGTAETLGTTAGTADCVMGMSIRTRGWRYTAWTNFSYDGQVQGPLWDALRGEELYDHAADDAGAPGQPDRGLDFDLSELASLAGDPAHAAIKASLRAQLQTAYPQVHFPVSSAG